MRPNKSSGLHPEWSFLPQLVTKKKRQHETKPWRSRFCKSDAARWESIKQLQGHISRQHSLHKKGDFSDLEPPSARKEYILPAWVTQVWNELKSEAAIKKKSKKKTPKEQRDDAL